MIKSAFYRALYSATVAGTAMAVALSSPAVAQETPAKDAPAPETADGRTDAGDIVVTARRVEERLQDVPLSVAAFGSDTLDKLSIKTGTDLAKLDPAVTTPISTPRTRFLPYIRAQTPGVGVAPPQSVVTYVAEAPNIQPSLYDLSNVQIIKGPQGTLFGETATAGVILFEPKRPSGKFGGYVDGQVGNYGYFVGEAAINIPIFGDKWAIRASGQIRQRDGFTKAIYSRPGVQPKFVDDINYKSFRISSLLRPVDGLEIYTIYLRDQSEMNGTSVLLHAIYDATSYIRTSPAANAVTAARFLYFTGYEAPAGKTYRQLLDERLAQQNALGPRAFTADYDLSRKEIYWALINQITWNISDNVTFKNISSISQTRSRGTGFQIDASDLPIIDSTPQVCVAGVSPGDCQERFPKPWSNEARLNGTLFDGRLNWQGGFYYRKTPEKYAGPSGTVIIAASPSSIPLTNTATNNVCLTLYGVAPPCTQLSKTMAETYAGYAQLTFEVVDGVHVTGGYRRTWDYLKTTTVASPFNSVTFQGQTIGQSILGTKPLPGSRESVAEVPRSHYDTYTIGADWKITDDVMVYATHRKGHKTGGVNTGIPTGNALRFFGPESVKDVEFGLKGSFEAGGVRIRSDLALFTTDYSNIQRRTSSQIDGTLFVYVANVAKARIRGIEWALNVQPSPYFNVNFQYAYLDAKFTSWIDTVSCASDLTATGCAITLPPGTPGAGLVVTDHVKGTKTANGVTNTFSADRFGGSPKHRFSIQPTLSLGFLSERVADVSLSANITHQSNSVGGDSNYSLLIPAKDVLIPSRTLVDVRFDWKNFIKRDGFSLDLFVSATNLFDKTTVVTRSTFINLCGCIGDQYSEPRMVFGGFKARF